MSGPYEVVPYSPEMQIDDPGWVVLNGEEVPIAIIETEFAAGLLQQQLNAAAGEDTVELQMAEIVSLTSGQIADISACDANDEEDIYQIRISPDTFGAVVSAEGATGSIVLDVSCGILRAFYAKDDDTIDEYPAIELPLTE